MIESSSPDFESKVQQVSIFNEVEHEWHSMTKSKEILHRSMASCYFSRQEIFQLYNRFKAMSKLSAL